MANANDFDLSPPLYCKFIDKQKPGQRAIVSNIRKYFFDPDCPVS